MWQQCAWNSQQYSQHSPLGSSPLWFQSGTYVLSTQSEQKFFYFPLRLKKKIVSSHDHLRIQNQVNGKGTCAENKTCCALCVFLIVHLTHHGNLSDSSSVYETLPEPTGTEAKFQFIQCCKIFICHVLQEAQGNFHKYGKENKLDFSCTTQRKIRGALSTFSSRRWNLAILTVFFFCNATFVHKHSLTFHQCLQGLNSP